MPAMRAGAVSAVLLMLVLAGGAAGRAEAVDVGLIHAMRLTPVGSAAPPPLALVRVDGRTLTLGDLRGRPVLLYFWATW